MVERNRLNRLAAWFALLAIALAALMPTVSRTLQWRAAQAPSEWVEVCSSAGMHWVSLRTGEVSPTDPSRGGTGSPTLEACPYCVFTADRLGPPVAAHPPLPALGRAVAPAGTPPAQALWLAAAPPHQRGPPISEPPAPLPA